MPTGELRRFLISIYIAFRFEYRTRRTHLRPGFHLRLGFAGQVGGQARDTGRPMDLIIFLLTYKVLSNMTPEQLQNFKQRLSEDKARLEQELEDFGSKDPARPGRYLADYPESGSSSDDDNAMEIAGYSDEISIEARLDAELRDVKKALEAIEKGAYGLCKYCKKEIQLERLDARPSSSSCIKCKKVLTQEM